MLLLLQLVVVIYCIHCLRKQAPCKHSFAHTMMMSQGILKIQTKPKFQKFVVPFALVLNILLYAAHIFGCITVKTFKIHQLVAENTSETLNFRSVLNVDNCFKEIKHC